MKEKIIKNQGIATLPTVMVIGLLTLAIIVSITALTFNELLTSQGAAQSSTALFYAEAGARDALVRIARDKNYRCDGYDCYEVEFVANGCADSTGCAKIDTSAGLGTSADPIVIQSQGVVGASTRTVQVTVLLDNGTTDASLQNGEITSVVWTELTN